MLSNIMRRFLNTTKSSRPNLSPILLTAIPLLLSISTKCLCPLTTALSPRVNSQNVSLEKRNMFYSNPMITALDCVRESDGQKLKVASSLNYPAEYSSQRVVARVEKFARLPIWPVWQGVFIFFASKLFGEEFAARMEDSVGGRVCPNFFDSVRTSPFVLLVHHRHAFMNFDPIRYIQRTFFPEGFPAHPHRGFITVTYCLKGGMIHRDSLGIKQTYGAESRHSGKHVQWLTTGAGLQHEEMWDVFEPDKQDKGKLFWTSSQELYQIWLNLPAKHKMTTPRAQLLEAYVVEKSSSIPQGSTPIIRSEDGSIITTILCGEYNEMRASIECPTDASILRIQFTQVKPSTWTHKLPIRHKTVILYVRKGSIHIGSQRIPPHYTAYLTSDGEQLVIKSLEGEADVLLLSGQPIEEPIASQGSMVMNTQKEIQQAYMDFQRGYMGVPWSETLCDEDWREHVRQNPSRY